VLQNPLNSIRLNLLKHVFTYTYFVFVDINMHIITDKHTQAYIYL